MNGRLSTDLPRSGQYSFRLDLDGGSVAYRYDASRIPVMPGAHYRVEGAVRTTVLEHARARLSAWLVDQDGRPLSKTLRHADPYAARAADEGWHRAATELSADDPKAAFLVLEVGLLQPAQHAAQSLGRRALNPQDIHGTAWFDDITVSQVPRVVMTTDRPGNVFRRGDPVRLQVRVDDRFTDDLAAQIVPPGWGVSPPTFTFSLNPGEQFEKEVTIELPYNTVAGPKAIDASFTLQADGNASFTVPITVNLGLSDVGMQTIALRDGADVIVQQVITNYGDEPIDYSAFAVLPGQPRQERLVSKLAAGSTTVKRYKFTGAEFRPGSKVRAGLKETNGTRILNDEVPVQ